MSALFTWLKKQITSRESAFGMYDAHSFCVHLLRVWRFHLLLRLVSHMRQQLASCPRLQADVIEPTKSYPIAQSIHHYAPRMPHTSRCVFWNADNEMQSSIPNLVIEHPYHQIRNAAKIWNLPMFRAFLETHLDVRVVPVVVRHRITPRKLQ